MVLLNRSRRAFTVETRITVRITILFGSRWASDRRATRREGLPRGLKPEVSLYSLGTPRVGLLW